VSGGEITGFDWYIKCDKCGEEVCS
jgi:hypothetical protein